MVNECVKCEVQVAIELTGLDQHISQHLLYEMGHRNI